MDLTDDAVLLAIEHAKNVDIYDYDTNFNPFYLK